MNTRVGTIMSGAATTELFNARIPVKLSKMRPTMERTVAFVQSRLPLIPELNSVTGLATKV